MIFHENGTLFIYLTMVLFLLEMYCFSIILSRFRYVPSGSFIINNEGLTWNMKFHPWHEIFQVSLYYRGDKFWKPFFRGYLRYYRLSWHASDGMNEKMIDKIVINEKETIYLKIRNEKEKIMFHSIKEIVQSKGISIQNMDTDFSYSLFGKTYKFYEEIGRIFPQIRKKKSN